MRAEIKRFPSGCRWVVFHAESIEDVERWIERGCIDVR